LNENPTTSEKDVSFLSDTVVQLKYTFTEALAVPQRNVLSKKPGAWRGSIPYLQLILCLTEDGIKKMVDMWNDPNYNPVLPVFSLDRNYWLLTDCGYLKIQDMICADADKVKDILSGMCANLNHIILDWETSGQGDGGNFNGLDNADQESVTSEEDGGLAKLSPAALNCRASFLQGKPSYL
jgi:hypothetical protein